MNKKQDVTNIVRRLLKERPNEAWHAYSVAYELLRFNYRLSINYVENILAATAKDNLTVISWTIHGIPSYTLKAK